jgi:3',5'-cyclic AMP phosphodiesterase CpdA
MRKPGGLFLAAWFMLGGGCVAAVTNPAPAAAPAAATPAAPAGAWVPGNGRLPVLAPIPATQPFTFVVMGDNRGSSRGRQPKVFLDILAGIHDAHPAFAVTTGDMINGYSSNEAVLRLQWKGYCEALAAAGIPVFHAPGNHDINPDAPVSGRLYRELWGPTYYAFDYGSARFIALDTETQAHRVDDAQFAWLEAQLAGAGSRRVFLFFHEPLFPVDGHRGSSLDVHVPDRDKLHALFVAHRGAIAGVYQGHEHLYDEQSIDGVPYYISGGGGANLYAAPEKGGFHHFLLVSVSSATVTVEVRKYGSDEAKPASGAPPVRVKPGLLERWGEVAQDAAAWDAWDESVSLERIPGRTPDGGRAIRMSFDFDECQWPLLYATCDPAWDLSGVAALTVDVLVPPGLKGSLSVTMSIPGEGKTKYAAPAVVLRPGWNVVRTDLAGAWLPPAARAHAGSVEWMLATDNKKLMGAVTFEGLRAEAPAASRAPAP